MPTFLKDADPSRYVIYLGFLAIFVAFSIVLRDDGFATASNLLNIVQQTAPVTVMAVGMVFVLTAGEIDLSIGSIVAIAALLAAVVLRDWPWPPGSSPGR
jgi:ribose transport system permease protein